MMDGNTRMDDLEQHLLFHKALADDDESLRRIGGYMDILSRAETGERLQDPVDESIRAVFSLVLENGIDPWEVDLSEFVRMYEAKVAGDRFDMIVAGKLTLMAWKVLRMQSESTRMRSEPPVEVELEEPDDSFFFDEPMYVPEVSFREAFQRRPERPVTVYELIDAFEDARREIEIQAERERVRRELKAREPKRFDNKAHDEDDERDVEAVWNRIEKLGAGQIEITDLYTGNLKDDLTTFVAVLHLVRDGRLDAWQDEYPYGKIYLEIRTEWMSGTLEDSPDRIPEAVNRFGGQGGRRGGALLQPGEPAHIRHSGEDRLPRGGGPHGADGSPQGVRRARFRHSHSEDRVGVPHDAPSGVFGLHGRVRQGGDVRGADEDPQHHRLQPAGAPIGAGPHPRAEGVRGCPQADRDGLRIRQAERADRGAHNHEEVLGVLRDRVHEEGGHPQMDRVAGIESQEGTEGRLRAIAGQHIRMIISHSGCAMSERIRMLLPPRLKTYCHSAHDPSVAPGESETVISV